MTTDNPNLTVPARIAEKAEAIYEEQFQAEVEAVHSEGFVAIDVLSEAYYFAETAEDALQTARKKAPNGVFHLIRLGAPAAAGSSYGWGDGTTASWAL